MRGTVRRRQSDAFDPVAAARLLDRIATLVAAGASPHRAWELVGAAGDGPAGGAVRRVSAHPDVRAVLEVAARTGAPAAPTLHALAGALRRSAGADRAVLVALAGPRTSATVVLALPVVGMLLAAMAGVDTLTVLTGTPAGRGCLAVAAALVALGRWWSRRLVRAVEPDGRIPGVLLDVWAVALSGGGSWSGAGDAVRQAGAGRHVDPDEQTRLSETLTLARRAGVPAAALLRSAAEDLRDDAAAAALAAAERLGVRLVVPLGVCVLPAFVLVGVVPVVVALLSSTVGELV